MVPPKYAIQWKIPAFNQRLLCSISIHQRFCVSPTLLLKSHHQIPLSHTVFGFSVPSYIQPSRIISQWFFQTLLILPPPNKCAGTFALAHKGALSPPTLPVSEWISVLKRKVDRQERIRLFVFSLQEPESFLPKSMFFFIFLRLREHTETDTRTFSRGAH